MSYIVPSFFLSCFSFFCFFSSSSCLASTWWVDFLPLHRVARSVLNRALWRQVGDHRCVLLFSLSSCVFTHLCLCVSIPSSHSVIWVEHAKHSTAQIIAGGDVGCFGMFGSCDCDCDCYVCFLFLLFVFSCIDFSFHSFALPSHTRTHTHTHTHTNHAPLHAQPSCLLQCPPPKSPNARVELKDLSLEERERVLRLLFARMNSNAPNQPLPAPPMVDDDPEPAEEAQVIFFFFTFSFFFCFCFLLFLLQKQRLLLCYGFVFRNHGSKIETKRELYAIATELAHPARGIRSCVSAECCPSLFGPMKRRTRYLLKKSLLYHHLIATTTCTIPSSLFFFSLIHPLSLSLNVSPLFSLARTHTKIHTRTRIHNYSRLPLSVRPTPGSSTPSRRRRGIRSRDGQHVSDTSTV